MLNFRNKKTVLADDKERIRGEKPPASSMLRVSNPDCRLPRAIYRIPLLLSRETSPDLAFNERCHLVKMVPFCINPYAEHPFRPIILHRSLHLDGEVVDVRFERCREVENVGRISPCGQPRCLAYIDSVFDEVAWAATPTGIDPMGSIPPTS